MVGDPSNPGDTWYLQYCELIAPMVKCIQDQKKMIEDLQARVIALENK
jgi:hypothetical protein